MEFLLALRRRGIMRAEVLRAMDEVAREQFVGAQDHALAYGDHALPIACGQSISQPYIVAYMTEQLDLRPEHCVLEIGTGSGYQAAVLARIAREVISIERYRTLAQAARARLEAQGVKNVTVIVGDGMLGLKGRAPFDRILVTAATPEPPPALVAQLAQDGIMVVPLGPRDGPQRIVKLTKTNEGLARADLIAVRFVPLLPGKAHEL
ncbi:MAG: protein-L-isoaspartate(D-aspartate) O-methyltransferase [Proteobacteria bacterium]|nr:protein-L-isoaspartate(D-aspartate) O-methyltransferase [Pseudomonadota bacterium]